MALAQRRAAATMKCNSAAEHRTFMRKRADNHVVWTRRTLLAAAAIAPALGTRIAAAVPEEGSQASPRVTPTKRDGQHDFDFEIGTWKTHLRRLVHPLSGSTSWVEYEGTTVVRRVWNGRANLVELEV